MSNLSLGFPTVAGILVAAVNLVMLIRARSIIHIRAVPVPVRQTAYPRPRGMVAPRR